MAFSEGDQMEGVIISLVLDQSSSTTVVVLRCVKAVSPNLNDSSSVLASVKECTSGEKPVHEVKGWEVRDNRQRWLERDFRVEPTQSMTFESE